MQTAAILSLNSKEFTPLIEVECLTCYLVMVVQLLR